jgi:hypothetical protein
MVPPLERAMAERRRELKDLNASELSDVSGGVSATAPARLGDEPCKTPSPAGPIPMPYPLLLSGGLFPQ